MQRSSVRAISLIAAVSIAMLFVGIAEARDPCQPRTLKEAAQTAGIRVGVAAAPHDEAYDRIVTEEFSALSLEGELLWSVVHPERDTWSWKAADRTLAFASQAGLFTTATHFVWDQNTEYTGTPQWVKEITDPHELRAVMREHLSTITQRYGRLVNRWIVVNEPFDYSSDQPYQNHFYRVLGPDYIAETFRIAHEAAPDAELWLNDVLLEYDPAKADAMVDLAAQLVAEGVPIDGVGFQGHLFLGDPDYELIKSTMRRIGELGLETAFTEVDAPVDASLPDRLETQATRLGRLVEACVRVPACESITFWGVHDGVSWLNSFLGPGRSPLLYDESPSPKPAYFAVRDALVHASCAATPEQPEPPAPTPAALPPTGSAPPNSAAAPGWPLVLLGSMALAGLSSSLLLKIRGTLGP